MNRPHSLAELFSEVAVEAARLAPLPLAERVRLALEAEPLSVAELAARTGASPEAIQALVAAQPFAFIDLGAKLGVAMPARARAHVPAGGNAENPPNDAASTPPHPPSVEEPPPMNQSGVRSLGLSPLSVPRPHPQEDPAMAIATELVAEEALPSTAPDDGDDDDDDETVTGAEEALDGGGDAAPDAAVEGPGSSPL